MVLVLSMVMARKSSIHLVGLLLESTLLTEKLDCGCPLFLVLSLWVFINPWVFNPTWPML